MKKIFLKFRFIFILILIFFINCLNKKYEIYINDVKLFVELAVTPEERQKGLMNRENLPFNEGMLFVFQEEHHLNFWMKNTYIPLDIAFFDKEGFLIEIYSMEPQLEAVYSSSSPTLYALEVNRGWFEKNQIRKFARLHLSEEIKKEINKRSKEIENLK